MLDYCAPNGLFSSPGGRSMWSLFPLFGGEYDVLLLIRVSRSGKVVISVRIIWIELREML